MQVRFGRRSAALLLATALLAGIAPRSAVRADDPPAAPGPTPPASPAAAKRRFPTDKEKAEILPLFRNYLEGDSVDAFKHRIYMGKALEKLQASGADILADIDKLKGLIYLARPFWFNFEKKNIPKEIAKESDVRFDSGSGVTSVKWGDYRFGISLPPAYVAARDAKKLNASPPWPMIVLLHSKEDYEDAKSAKPYPAEEAIKRVFPKATMKAVTDSWIVYAPVTPKGKFADDDSVKKQRIDLPQVFHHFHVDVDRIVIEGGPEALLFAAAYPLYYAGVIVHGDTSDIAADVAINLHNTFVYVVQTGDKVAPIYQTLVNAKHPDVQLAKGPPTAIGEWLPSVKHILPKSFKWVVKDKSAHRFAYWINVDVLDESVPLPSIEAEIVDTAEEPNTIKLRTTGVHGITIFLNDQLVDLDREVKVIANGKPIEECRIESNRPEGLAVRLPAKFERTLDGMFDRRQLSIRKSQIYSMLFPVMLEQIEIKGDAPAEEVPDPDSAGTSAKDQAEKAAANYFKKALEKEGAGEFVKARDLFQKAADAGDTTWKDKAEAKVKELEAKCPSSPGEPGMGPEEPGMGETARTHTK